MCNDFEPADAYEPFPLNEEINPRDGSFDTFEEDQAEYEAWLDWHDEHEQAEAEAEMSRYDDDPSPYAGTYDEYDGE